MAARYSQQQVLDLLQALYSVAEGSSHWVPMLEQLREVTRSTAAGVRRANFETGEGAAIFWSPVDGEGAFEYARYHSLARTLMTPVRDRFITPGAVVTRRMVVSDEVFEASPFYRDFLARHGFYHFINLVIEVRGAWALNLTMGRGREAGDFDAEDLALVQTLAPHLRRAIGLSYLLSGALNLKGAFESSIDRVPIGVVLVDAELRAIALNSAAREILERQDGLRIAPDGRLQAAQAGEQAELSRLLAAAAGVGASAGEGSTLRLTSSSGDSALAALVSPLRLEQEALSDPRVLAAVFVRDPEHRPAATEEALRRLYGLTRAEARLASLLVSGLSLEEAARRLDVTTNTARTHLKRVFAKTRTGRQGDLISLLLSGVESLRSPGLSGEPPSRPA